MTKKFSIYKLLLSSTYILILFSVVFAFTEKGNCQTTTEISSQKEKQDLQNSADTRQKQLYIDPNYRIPPRIVPKDKVSQETTSFSLNGVAVSHLTEWQILGGSTFGDNINYQPSFNSIFTLSSQVEESLSNDNIFVRKHTGSYLQVRTIRSKKTITTTTKIPQTLLGFQLQLSLTGDCDLFYLGSNTTDQCTLTPGVVIDKEDNINPETLLPRNISQTSRVGTVVSQENLNFIRQPGFQRGIEGQEIGIDLYIPNAGAVFGNSISRQTTIRRQEEIDVLPAGSFSTIEQIIKVNHEKAVLGRTVRGIPVIPEGEEPWLYTLSSGASFLLPTIDPKLEGSDKPVDPRANRNLFLASNNARLPPASFVVYQIGVGEADTPKSEVEELSQLPSAMYNSIWFGFSPDVRISLHNRSYLEILGSERIIESAGGEGGVADFSNINSIVSFSNQIINPDDLSRFYVQAYARFFATEVNAINQTIIDEDTIYAPHISFTGNLTYTDKVFRYYLGTIFSDDVRSYLGADYNQNLSNDLDLNIGAIGYINPNREYYSQTWGSLTKNFPLSDNQNFTLVGRFNYAIDRPVQASNFAEAIFPSLASFLILEGQYNWDWFSIKIGNNFGGVLPNSLKNQLFLGTTFNISPFVNLSGYFAPIDENSSSIKASAGINFRLGQNSNSPFLSFNWSQYRYDFGTTPQGDDLIQKDNIFQVVIRFGQ
ncbi:hypothetical protein [Cyanobacterium aponinum]|uniref:hypothetical protein n=1 Tax=Cyanobacterium aponinum TaxID=379064 RepID=UPI000C12A289|nr:hypothetical protein [Cyanobacterium aponinum]PHV63271.1 hypothetical protein CSQ80_05900 [Cyanobacterium aponinum IPPAS B-1201]